MVAARHGDAGAAVRLGIAPSRKHRHSTSTSSTTTTMSLFHSAFGTPGAGSSKPLSFGTSGGAGKKRRGKASIDDDALRSTAVNVQKLMAQVERGELAAEKAAAGGEALGQLPRKKKRRGSAAGRDEDGPAAHAQGQAQAQAPAGPPGKKQKRKSALAQLSAPSAEAERAGEPAPRLAEAPKGKKNKNKNKNKQPGDEPRPVVQKAQPKAKGTEGLTKMQQQMANKLEGARFRWINEQLYTTPSTEAVAMMKKEPKIFEDVSDAGRARATASDRAPSCRRSRADSSTTTRTAC